MKRKDLLPNIIAGAIGLSMFIPICTLALSRGLQCTDARGEVGSGTTSPGSHKPNSPIASPGAVNAAVYPTASYSAHQPNSNYITYNIYISAR